MIHPAVSRPLSFFLAVVISSPYLAAQNPPAPAPAGQATGAAAGAAQPPANPAPSDQVPANPNGPFAQQRLHLMVLEGDKVTNSIPTQQSTAAIVEVRDANDFPVEGAEVVFTLSNGSAGTFARGGLTYTTRTDVSGQAAAPPVIPKSAGKFEINVTATLGNRKGETQITQTNSTNAHIAEAKPVGGGGGTPFYKRKLFWIATGVAAGGIVAAVLLTGSSSTVTVTPGTPVFH